MERQSGPLIFVGLYVAALILTWITLFSMERFGETEVRSWAPLIQALLSAGAIFSAWWLQDLKRVSDRKDAAHDTLRTMNAIFSQMEMLAKEILRIRRDGILRDDHITYLSRCVLDSEALVRRMNLGYLPNDTASRAALDMLLYMGQFAASAEAHGRDTNGRIELRKVNLLLYRKMFIVRTRFLAATKQRDD